jgi:hypothetical protein
MLFIKLRRKDKNEMEDLLAKIGVISFFIGVFGFLLRRYAVKRDEEIKELKETIKMEVTSANKHFEKLYGKTDTLNKELSRLEGYIEGKEK